MLNAINNIWQFIVGNISNIAHVSTTIGTIGSLFLVRHTFKKYSEDKSHRDRLLKEQELINLRRDINNKIEIFYGPINGLRKESRMLYDVFALELKQKARDRNECFRTLEHLCDPNTKKLSPSDESLLNEIMILSKKTLDLIEKNSWVISNAALHSLLGKACAHFRVLELAYNNKLNGKWEHIKHMVFPLELDGALTNERRRLEYNYKKQSIINRMVPDYLRKNKTIEYYDDHYDSYLKETISVDMSDIYKKFRNTLKNNSSILDLGCGVGRDTKYFIQHGFNVLSIDLSSKMVELCNRYPFAYCEQMDMKNIEYYEEFDAIWANASLLHLTRREFRSVLTKMIDAVKIGGVIFFSLKKSESRIIKDNRLYTYYEEDEIKSIFNKYPQLELIECWQSQKDKSTNSSCFLNFIMKKH